MGTRAKLCLTQRLFLSFLLKTPVLPRVAMVTPSTKYVPGGWGNILSYIYLSLCLVPNLDFPLGSVCPAFLPLGTEPPLAEITPGLLLFWGWGHISHLGSTFSLKILPPRSSFFLLTPQQKGVPCSAFHKGKNAYYLVFYLSAEIPKRLLFQSFIFLLLLLP